MASTHRDEISRLELLHAAHPDGLVFPHLADAYRRAGRYAQAESVLEAGLEHHGDYSSAHLVLGRLRRDQGQPEDARRAFGRVLQLDPENHVALEQLGEMAADEGRLDESIEYFRRLRRVKADHRIDARIREVEARRGTAPSSGNGGDRPAPRVSEPGDVVTETMAELYARQGLFDRAAAVYRQLLEASPGDARLVAKLEQVQRNLPGQEGRPTESAAPARRHPAPASRGPARSTGTGSAPSPDGWRHSEHRQFPPSAPTIGRELKALLSWRRPRGSAPPTPDPFARPQAEAVSVQEAGTAPVPKAEAAPVQEAEAAPVPHGHAGPVSADPSRKPSPWDPGVVESGSRPDDGLRRFEGASAHMKTLLALSDLLVGLLEYRDPFFRGSSSLTRLMAMSVAEEMGLSREDQAHLALAATLRDLGRLALGGRLLPAPKLKPSAESRRKIERHVDLALHLLEGVDLPASVRHAVRYHHERWDGAGYPDGLAAEDIPLLARILAVVDSFSAMVSPRPYRLPRKVPDAARELRQERGTRYDPHVVDALLRVIERREQPHLGFVQRQHILLVDPDQPGAVVTGAKLCSAGYLAEVMSDATAARERLRRVPVAALVLSAEAGEEATADFVRDLRSDPAFGALPIVVVQAESVGLRVRLLESGADVCFPPGITHAELQGTLGALVRRTLRVKPEQTRDASGDSAWLALQGDIRDFPLTWLLQVMKYDSRTAAIGIRTASREGAIYLRNGDAVHAEIRRGAKGEVALRDMLQWSSGRFTVQPEAKPREQTIRTSIMHLLLTQAVAEDHAAAGIFGAVSAGS